MNLILIEGMFGSGKSTTTQLLSDKLVEYGRKVRCYVESDPNNPVGLSMSLSEADATIKKTCLETYPFDTWKSLSISSDEFILIEARLIQNSSFWAMLNGQSDMCCIELPRRILEAINSEIDVKLVILDQNNPVYHIGKVIDERGKKHPDWLPCICDLFDKQKWAANKNIKGVEGFIEAQLNWVKLFPRIINNLECDKLHILNPQSDWEQTMSEIIQFITAEKSYK